MGFAGGLQYDADGPWEYIQNTHKRTYKADANGNGIFNIRKMLVFTPISAAVSMRGLKMRISVIRSVQPIFCESFPIAVGSSCRVWLRRFYEGTII